MRDLTIGPSPIQGILYAGYISQFRGGENFTATSLPGHLLHYVIDGRVRQECNGRTYELTAGSVLWYHEDEWVTGTVLEAPWNMYSINFIAPHYPPPPFEARLFSGNEEMRNLFAEVIEYWNQPDEDTALRSLRVHGRLLRLLELLRSPQSQPRSQSQPQPPFVEAPSRLWWDLETRVRRDLSRPIGLRTLEEWSGCSAATIARSAQSAVEQSPMKRIKQIRLSLARGLVQRSSLSLSRIAEQVGYNRPHEFSRDYRKHFGIPPRDDRKGQS